MSGPRVSSPSMRPGVAASLVLAAVAAAWLTTRGCETNELAPPDIGTQGGAVEHPQSRAPSSLARSPPPDSTRTPEEIVRTSGSDLSKDSASQQLLRGVVIDEAGVPLPDALVYLIPRGPTGSSTGSPLAHVGTATDGSWSMPSGATAKGRWIVALSDLHVPTFTDGDTAAVGEPLRIQLRTGRRVKVLLTGDPDRKNRTVVRVTGLARDGTRFPSVGGNPQPTRVLFLDAGVRETEFTIGTWGRLSLNVEHLGYAAMPDRLVLDEATNVAEFQLSRSCRLECRVTSADASTPVVTDVEFSLLRSDGSEVCRGRSRSPEGLFVIESGVAPGLHLLIVNGEGYGQIDESISFARSGESRVVHVALRPAVGRELTVTWPLVSELTHSRVPSVLIRANGDAHATWEGVANARPTAPLGVVVPMVSSGPVDMLLMDWKSRGAVFVRNIVFGQGESQRSIVVEWKPGLEVSVGGAFEATGTVSKMRVRCAEIGELPVVRLNELGLWIGNQAGAMTGSQSLLGPYPCEEVTVTGFDETASLEKSVTVKRASR